MRVYQCMCSVCASVCAYRGPCRASGARAPQGRSRTAAPARHHHHTHKSMKIHVAKASAT
eukprot:38340-Eustigmatos_ZCMA.PRE.1